MAAQKNNQQTRFIVAFIGLFLLFYYFNIAFWGIVSPGGSYNAFLADHLNYIAALRHILIVLTTKILTGMGYMVVHNTDEILVAGHGMVRIAYSCLGLGVVSFFAAFVIAYPKPVKRKLIFLLLGIFAIQLLNLCRCVILALYWGSTRHVIDHHVIFNVFIYIVISVTLYFWIKEPRTKQHHAKN